MQKTKASGSGHKRVIVLSSIAIGLLAILCVYQFVLNRPSTKTVSVSSPSVATAKPAKQTEPAETPLESTVADGPGDAWKTYTNNRLGFSIKIPREYMDFYAGECIQRNSITDANGNTVTVAPYYVGNYASVSTIVVEDGNNFYVAPKETYQLSGLQTDPKDGRSYNTTCNKMMTNAEMVSLAKSGTYLLNTLPFSVAPASGLQDISAWAKNYFDKDDVIVTPTQANQDGSQNYLLKTNNEEENYFNGVYRLKYYPAKKKLTYISLGQAGHFQITQEDGFYDSEMANSLTLK